MFLFGPPGLAEPREVADLLEREHYLGAATRGFAYADRSGVIVFGRPASRHLPQERWVELSRWCLTPGAPKNAGSQQWAVVAPWLREHFPDYTTVISYSDPGVGHTGALYRACNWLWAPTWLRLTPPPSGNGRWATHREREVTEEDEFASVKDRWVFPLAPDAERESILSLASHEHARRKFPWAEYREPKWKRGRVIGGGGDFKRWMREQAHAPNCDLDHDCTCKEVA